MRGTAAILALALLLGGLLAPCPACIQAEAEQAPPDAHACCRKAVGDEAAPVSGSPAKGAPDKDVPSPDCATWALHRTLAGLAADPQETFVKVAGAITDQGFVASPFDAGYRALASDDALVAEVYGPPGSGVPSPAAVASMVPLRL